jgi:TorA maturation chaperone TorD
MITHEQLLRERMRGDCYQLLASCFYQPQKQLFFEEKVCEKLSSALNHVCPGAAIFSNRMENVLSRYSDEELSVEYAKLFVGPFELKAPPYGSVYIDGDKRVMGDSTMEILKMYRQTGLSIKDDFKDLPDHISVELEFMYFLIYHEIESFQKSQTEKSLDHLKMQVRFLNQYLGHWILPFCHHISDGTENEFYHSLSECARRFVINDMSHMNLFIKDFLQESAKD